MTKISLSFQEAIEKRKTNVVGREYNNASLCTKKIEKSKNYQKIEQKSVPSVDVNSMLGQSPLGRVFVFSKFCAKSPEIWFKPRICPLKRHFFFMVEPKMSLPPLTLLSPYMRGGEKK